MKKISMKMREIIELEEVLFLLGVTFTSYGIALIYFPAAFIFLGVALMSLSVVLSRR